MDFLQVCYRSKMRLYPDRPDVLTTGRWRWCPEGAEALPFPHAFGSMLFDPANWTLPADQVGEVEWLGKVKGDGNPRYRGRHHCGAPELYLHGSPYALRGSLLVDPEGVPLCCDAAAALGGLALGGEGVGSSWYDVSLWLQPEGLTGPAEGDPLVTWPGAPLTPLNGSQFTSTQTPYYHFDEGTRKWGADLANGNAPGPQGSILTWSALTFDDWTAIVVCRPDDNTSGFSLTNLAQSSYTLAVLDGITFATSEGTGTVVSADLGGEAGQLAVWASRREGDTWSLWRNGAQLAEATGPTGPQLVTALFATTVSFNPGFSWIPEILLFPRALSAAELSAEFEYLAAKYAEVDTVPTGALQWFALDTPVDGYLLCDGADYEESAFPSLADYLGGAYDEHRGASPPSAGRFRVPDFRGLGLVGGGGASVNPTTSVYATGETGGEEDHTLTDTEVPATSVTVTDPGHQHGTGTAGTAAIVAGAGNTKLEGTGAAFCRIGATLNQLKTTGITADVAGGGGAHNNLPPIGTGWLFIKT